MLKVYTYLEFSMLSEARQEFLTNLRYFILYLSQTTKALHELVVKEIAASWVQFPYHRKFQSHMQSNMQISTDWLFPATKADGKLFFLLSINSKRPHFVACTARRVYSFFSRLCMSSECTGTYMYVYTHTHEHIHKHPPTHPNTPTHAHVLRSGEVFSR
jgi:hypothetical protein